VANDVRSQALTEAFIAMLNVSPMPRAFLVIFPEGDYKNRKKEKDKR
jgi:hypothetical protein